MAPIWLFGILGDLHYASPSSLTTGSSACEQDFCSCFIADVVCPRTTSKAISSCSTGDIRRTTVPSRKLVFVATWVGAMGVGTQGVGAKRTLGGILAPVEPIPAHPRTYSCMPKAHTCPNSRCHRDRLHPRRKQGRRLFTPWASSLRKVHDAAASAVVDDSSPSFGGAALIWWLWATSTLLRRFPYSSRKTFRRLLKIWLPQCVSSAFFHRRAILRGSLYRMDVGFAPSTP